MPRDPRRRGGAPQQQRIFDVLRQYQPGSSATREGTVSTTRMLISLLPAEESDRLLRPGHGLLPPLVDATIPLLRPPEPHLGDAALGLADAEVLIVRNAGHEGSAVRDAADE